VRVSDAPPLPEENNIRLSSILKEDQEIVLSRSTQASAGTGFGMTFMCFFTDQRGEIPRILRRKEVPFSSQFELVNYK
jgi:hypothetical protein